MATRDAILCATDAFQARLVHYRPGLRQDDHEHARAQISFLLLGDAREIVGRREAEVSCAASGVKPAGIRHAAEFGKNGALMLAFDFAADAEPQMIDWTMPCTWQRLPSEFFALARSALNAAPEERADLFWDMLACLSHEEAQRRQAPLWLERIRDQIADDPVETRIADLAASAGVHRVYLSRRFQAAFGLVPSLYRSRCMTARGLHDMVGGASLAAAAAHGGFADQSHMTRAFQRHAGLSPKCLLRYLA